MKCAATESPLTSSGIGTEFHFTDVFLKGWKSHCLCLVLEEALTSTGLVQLRWTRWRHRIQWRWVYLFKVLPCQMKLHVKVRNNNTKPIESLTHWLRWSHTVPWKSFYCQCCCPSFPTGAWSAPPPALPCIQTAAWLADWSPCSNQRKEKKAAQKHQTCSLTLVFSTHCFLFDNFSFGSLSSHFTYAIETIWDFCGSKN